MALEHVPFLRNRDVLEKSLRGACSYRRTGIHHRIKSGGRLSPEHALGEALDEIARAPPHAGTRPGVLTLAHDDVVGLQDVPAERVTAAPQIDAERPIGLLAPPRADLVARGIETLGPVPHGELVVVR